MIIGIDVSRAFIKNRTGIEEYSYQVVKNLRNKLRGTQVVLYIRPNQEVGFELPSSWEIKKIKFTRLWTQVGLSWEIFRRPVDMLFIPAHTVPVIHPKNTVVTIHGLEYEFCPEAYSWWERFYMRWSIKNSCRWASKIIAVSKSTKKDLTELYEIPPEKIEVIYEGYNLNSELRITNFESISNDKISKPYLLFIGRLEERKNILGIIQVLEILKEKYKFPHSLVLAGSPGYGYKKIKFKIQNLPAGRQGPKLKVLELGYVDEAKKQQLLKNADIFLFPSYYEGFGIPILEAQSSGVPVVTSNVASMPEVSDSSAVLVNPKNPAEIAEAVYKLISDNSLREEIIKKGYENIKRFSWDKCAEAIKEIITT